MKEFKFFMPTQIVFGKDCILNNADMFKTMGQKALIVTGKHSSKTNGSLTDVISALDKCGVGHVVFDQVEENPTIETVLKIKELGLKEKIDFVIGIGGGSAIDASKAASGFIKNTDKDTKEFLAGDIKTFLPMVAVPTTAGTGTEATKFTVITMHELNTKVSPCRNAFPNISFIDAKYTVNMPGTVTRNTAVDALTHLIEAYVHSQAYLLNDMIIENGLKLFKECISSLIDNEYSYEVREKLLLASTLAGIAISNSGTSLPHALGYMPTYYKDVPHGRANSLFMSGYLRLFGEDEKVNKLLSLIGFSDIQELQSFFDKLFKNDEKYTEDEIESYTDEVMIKNKAKLSSFPREITRDEMYNLFKTSLIK
ncbi:MAG: iron-containing alcohol dehydrogenase family protein [Lachnospiraceae bacterium]|nr:iron-containing alcohol dehydrogenase family protein [Lachnospiraceae bacterium]